jgi:hypothetical protein
MYDIIKVGSYHKSLKKLSSHRCLCSKLFLLSTPLSSNLALTMLNCRYKKSKITSYLNIQLIRFEHLNNLK